MIENSTLRSLISGVRRIELQDDGVTVTRSNGVAQFHPFTSLNAPLSVSNGILGASLRIDGEVFLKRIRPNDLAALVPAYEAARKRYWEAQATLALKQVEQAQEVFQHYVERQGYLRSSVLSQMESELRKYQPAVKVIRDCAELGLKITKQAEGLGVFLDDPDSWRQRFNADWEREQEQRFAPFFDTLEKHPLTPPQRRACLLDGDNVLVLAGAGTGKTSTMMAKAAYLVRSGLARPEEILMLAFAKKARDELEERVHGMEGMQGVRVETFHSLGSRIIGSAEGARLAVSILAQDEIKRAKYIEDGLEALRGNEDFLAHLRIFFSNYLVPMPNELEFKSSGDYTRYLKQQEIRSLKGDAVKSFAELEIANYLFMNGINYVYEGTYKHPTATPSRRQYMPDFYLPDLDVYIEHFGIDRAGNTAPYVDKTTYWEGIHWKRGIHKQFDTALIETYSYERNEGELSDNLEQRLIAHCQKKGIDFRKVIREQPFEALKALGSYTAFSKLLDGFLNVFKGSTWTIRTLQDQLGATWNDSRLRVFLRIFEVVLARYEETLAQSHSIDFNDMIKKAIKYVQSGEFTSGYRYIMVDEFQDISPSRATLVKALRDQVPGCALFCVGDDWQAIYRFTGSDVTLTTKFRENFGATERVDLDRTFRFNNRICDVASKFVQVNPGQLRKDIKTHSTSNQTEVAVISELDKVEALQIALKDVSAHAAGRRASVFLLARYNDSEPAEMHTLQHQHPNLKLSFYTAHRSKGLEADYVIILDLIQGKKGFPSIMSTDPIIERILPHAEEFLHAEERRLFYVALTRARHSVWLLTQPGRESPFISELLQGGYDVRFDREAMKAAVIAQAHCPVCLEGVLEPRRGSKGVFYGCSLFPYCDGVALPCPKCGQGAFTSVGLHHRCSNPDCNFEADNCPSCGVGYLRLNQGKYGAFYGCSNWRGDNPASCNYKRKAPKTEKML